MRISLKHWLRLRREPWRKIFYDAYRRWKKDRMEPLRLQFSNLTEESVVFDIGGFEGGWADEIAGRYGCTVHIFEPHPRFAAKLQQKYLGNKRITVHPFALGSVDGTLNLSDSGDASSAVSGAIGAVTGQVIDVARFLKELPVERVALAKINIEGGEYDLLPALFRSGNLRRFDVIQVQFHLYTPDDIASRDAIRADLAQTHTQDWAYEFVWEQWSRILDPVR